LIDSRAYACFIDEDFIKLYKIHFITKPYAVPIKVIDEQPLGSGHVTHETIFVKIGLRSHNNFNPCFQ